jgi:hypothetical protein
VLWLLARLHPAFRKRAKQSVRAIDERFWLQEFARWEREWKPKLYATNRSLGDIDPTSLSDADLVAAGHRGLDEGQVMVTLTGASRATSAPARALGATADEPPASGSNPNRLETFARRVVLRPNSSTSTWPNSVIASPPVTTSPIARHVILEAGRRLVSSGALDELKHVFDTAINELVGLLKGRECPSAAELGIRHRDRFGGGALPPPLVLGCSDRRSVRHRRRNGVVSGHCSRCR